MTLGLSVRTNCDELPENRQFVALPPLYGVGATLAPGERSDVTTPSAIVRNQFMRSDVVSIALVATSLLAKDPTEWKQGKLLNLDIATQSRIGASREKC
jgi:hypothetical protein